MDKTKANILEEIAADRRDLWIQSILTALTGVGLIGGVLGTWLMWPMYVTAGLYLLAYLAGGLPAAKEALLSLKDRELNIDLLMVLAALAAAGVGEVRDGAILLFLFSLAGTLEHYAMGNTKRSVAALMDMRPDEANRKKADGTTERVVVELLAIGDQVVVRPAERIPIDGEVVAGNGAVNQAPITGESVPVDKAPGDKVFAGSVNENAVLTIEVTALAARSTLARMIELVTEAQEKRSPSESFGDWFGQRYTVVVLVGSILGLIAFLLLGLPTDEAFYKAATLLVVASPCAIVISVPAAILSALAAAARHGVLFKGGAALEDFGNTKVLALDKTGTLTHGVMEVAQVVAFGEETTFLKIAGQLETHSDHPLARSIVAYVTSRGIAVSHEGEATAVPGKGVTAVMGGVTYWAGNRAIMTDYGATLPDGEEAALAAREAEGETPIIIGEGETVLGYITLADTVRDSAVAALQRLKHVGIAEIVMLTGDSKIVAEAIGAKLGLAVGEIRGGLLPEDKVNVVRELADSRQVAFVGDGVNDAAALATARVGIAMGVAGTDAAIEAADVALLSDDLRKLVYAYTLSRKANRVIRQNLIFACGIMVVMVITTVFWYLPLPLGVIGHEGGTLLVVANGLRLLFTKEAKLA
ncbi:MAG: heavy metal translocating P-type ATPase [Candidatus Pacebacteria bacterium]|jgi:heavy metal translocating P-type ATPase|nr:heavy metal translocating P-type ATPase [Candidatus Paceibacterota bacterium]